MAETLAHVEIIWPDGTMSRAGSWEELETNIRITQWRGFATLGAFRREMAARARAWSGLKVETDGDSETFLSRLAAAGLFMVVCNEPDTEQKGTRE